MKLCAMSLKFRFNPWICICEIWQCCINTCTFWQPGSGCRLCSPEYTWEGGTRAGIRPEWRRKKSWRLGGGNQVFCRELRGRELTPPPAKPLWASLLPPADSQAALEGDAEWRREMVIHNLSGFNQESITLLKAPRVYSFDHLLEGWIKVEAALCDRNFADREKSVCPAVFLHLHLTLISRLTQGTSFPLNYGKEKC